MPGLKKSVSAVAVETVDCAVPTAPLRDEATTKRAVRRFIFDPQERATKTRKHEAILYNQRLLRVFVPSWPAFLRASKLEPDRELRLPRRRVDERQNLVDLPENRRRRIVDRRPEIGAVRDVEQLRQELESRIVDRH